MVVDDVVVEPYHSEADERSLCPGARPLYMAALSCNLRGMATLLAMGADPDAATANGDTALHALAYGKKSVERALPCAALLAQAAPCLGSRTNRRGLTPAALAASQGSVMAGPLLAFEESAVLSSCALAPPPRPPSRL